MSKLLNERWEASNRRIEAYLKAVYPQGNRPQEQLYEAMRYSLLAGGKRLRPFLAQEFCTLCGGRPETALPAAAAVELIHTYSLIHDDLPCMDNDDYRRGKLTSHKVYGEALAVLAGDGLLTDAFSLISKAELPPSVICKCVAVLSACAGSDGMVGGQVLDMESETRRCTEEEVYAIQSRKTGALISSACELGVLCAEGSEEQQTAARRYAQALGLAFQIRDDILDVTGDAALLGKATGVDTDKNTFVRLYGVEKCQQMVAKQTELAIQALQGMKDSEVLCALAGSLSERVS